MANPKQHIVYCCFVGNFLKMFGPVIKAQFDNYPEVKPILWICTNYKNYKPKAGTELSPSHIIDLEKRFPGLKIIISESLTQIVKNYSVIAVVSVAFSFPLDEEEFIFLKRNHVKLCSLGYVGEEILYILNRGIEVLDKWDIVTTFSTFWIDIICDLIDDPTHKVKIREKLIPVGFVQLDQVQDFDSDEIRKKYKIPLDKRIIYFSTYPFFYSIIPYRYKYIDLTFRKGGKMACHLASKLSQIIFPQLEIDGIISYSHILSSLKAMAQRKDFLIVAKSRKKHKDPDIVRSYSDSLFYDESYYPFSTLELMYISDIYIGFQSASIIEALFLGKYSVTLLPIPRTLYDKGLGSFGKDSIFENYLWRIEGISDFFKLYKNEEYERYVDLIDEIDNIDYNDEQRRLSVKKIFSNDDCNASDRFLSLIFSDDRYS